jgi:hypothetical protein
MAETARRPIEPAVDGTDDRADEIDLGVPRDGSRSELLRALGAARREFLAANGRFLTREELEQELAERRGGVDRSDDR